MLFDLHQAAAAVDAVPADMVLHINLVLVLLVPL
jgi:hypothetical protein